MSEPMFIALAINALLWAHAAGRQMEAMRVMRERDKKMDERMDRFVERIEHHSDRLTTIETRCTEIQRKKRDARE